MSSEPLLFSRERLPGGDGVRFVDLRCVVHKVLELAQGHPGILGKCLGGVDRADPLEFLFGRPLEKALPDRAPGDPPLRLLGRIDVGQRVGIGRRPDADLGIDLFDQMVGHLGHKADLLVAAVLEQDLGCLVQFEHGPRMAAPLQHALEYGQDQRTAFGRAVNLHKLARLDIDRIVHQNAGHSFDSWVCHRSPLLL